MHTQKKIKQQTNWYGVVWKEMMQSNVQQYCKPPKTWTIQIWRNHIQ
jgi:hypothetical protein